MDIEFVDFPNAKTEQNVEVESQPELAEITFYPVSDDDNIRLEFTDGSKLWGKFVPNETFRGDAINSKKTMAEAAKEGFLS